MLTVFRSFFFILILTLSTQIEAAGFKLEENPEMLCVIKMSGEIVPGDAQKLQNLLNRVQPSLSIQRICLDSPGGNYLEAIKMAEILREDFWGTAVPAFSKCESACSIVFMAGQYVGRMMLNAVADRVIHPTAKLGFHAPELKVPQGYYNHDSVTSSYNIALKSISELLRLISLNDNFEFSPALIVKMLETPADSMWYINTTGLATMFGIKIHPVKMFSDNPSINAYHMCIGAASRMAGRELEKYEIPDHNSGPNQSQKKWTDFITDPNQWLVSIGYYNSYTCEVILTQPAPEYDKGNDVRLKEFSRTDWSGYISNSGSYPFDTKLNMLLLGTE